MCSISASARIAQRLNQEIQVILLFVDIHIQRRKIDDRPHGENGLQINARISLRQASDGGQYALIDGGLLGGGELILYFSKRWVIQVFGKIAHMVACLCQVQAAGGLKQSGRFYADVAVAPGQTVKCSQALLCDHWIVDAQHIAPIDDDVQAIIVWLGGIDDTKTFELINAVRTQKRGKMGSIHGCPFVFGCARQSFCA